MQSFDYSQLIARYQIVSQKTLTFLTPFVQIQELFTEEAQKPENLSENLYEPNDFYIEPKRQIKKKNSVQESKQILLIGKPQILSQEKLKKYKPGPFALFYQLNEGNVNKDAEVWYYKEHKDIVGPVSSYNMDKLDYLNKIDDQTRVAFKTLDKFVKLGKIRKILQEQKKDELK